MVPGDTTGMAIAEAMKGEADRLVDEHMPPGASVYPEDGYGIRPVEKVTREELAEMYPEPGRSAAVSAASDSPPALYALGQQHATEDVARLLRHRAALTGNRKLASLADDIEMGAATRLGAKRRRGG